MLRLRPFKLCDAPYLLNWFHDEKSFTMWSANKFTYPLTMEQLITYKNNYDEDPNAWIFVALDEAGTVVGHFMMRKADYKNQSVHLGFIVIDDSCRGKGYGKEMLNLAKEYAFHLLKVNRITLGVFANNEGAHQCYRSVGFVDEDYHDNFLTFKGESWGLFDMALTK